MASEKSSSAVQSGDKPEPEPRSARERRRGDLKQLFDSVTLFLAFVAAIAASISAKFAHDQVTVTRDDQRAWIAPPEITVKRNASVTTFNLIFKNVGRTPTHGFYVDATFATGTTWQSVLDRLCDKGKQLSANKPIEFYIWSSVPNASYTTSRVPERDFNGVPIDDLVKLGDPHIVGCVVYGEQPPATTLHKTGFVAPLKVSQTDVTVVNIYPIEPD